MIYKKRFININIEIYAMFVQKWSKYINSYKQIIDSYYINIKCI